MIVERMDAAFEKAAWRYPESAPNILYLTDDDWAEYDAAMSEAWGGKIHCFTFRNTDIRRGETSRLALKGGALVRVPTRLSPRVREAA
jgi:hypothetical protein